jgi:hypothetical protein
MFTFGKKTTATVLASFNQTLADLQQVEQEHAIEAEAKRVEADQALAASLAAAEEAKAARTVAGRIQALLNTEGIADGIGGAAPAL